MIGKSWLLRQRAALLHQHARVRQALRGLVVRDAMHTEVETIPAHLGLPEATSLMFRSGRWRSRPVVRGEAIVGMLSLRDVLAVSRDERAGTSVQAAMTRVGAGIVVGPGEPLLGTLARMLRERTGRLLVVEDGRLQGLLNLSSVVRFLRMQVALSS